MKTGINKAGNYPWKCSLFLMAYYVTNAVYQGFISIYYTSGAGVTDSQLSVLMAATPLVAIFMQPVWGTIGDKAKSRNNVLRIMIVLSAAAISVYRVSDSFWWLLIMSCLFAASYTSIQPMGDSIVLEALLENNQPFGPLRLTGCLSFAVMNVVFGYILDGRTNFTIYLTASMLALMFASTFKLPNIKGHQSSGRKMNLTVLFKQKELMLLLALLLLLQLTMGYFYSFFPKYFKSMPGGNETLLGICFFISAVSEVPFLLKSDRLFEKFGAGKLMCGAALACTARWIILATTNNIYVAMASQLLHSFGFIVMTVSMAKYVSATVPPELRASGQMLLSVVGFGIARVFGILGGGLLSGAMGGMDKGFILMAAISGLAFIVFTPIYMRRPAVNGAQK